MKMMLSDRSIPEEVRKNVEKHYDKYYSLIKKMAHKYVRGHRVEYDDLIQEALIGLVLAYKDFDPSRSEDFHTYAIYRMKGRMYAYCIKHENPIHVPTQIAKASSYIKQMQRLLEGEPVVSDDSYLIQDIIVTRTHEAEKALPRPTKDALEELKKKLENIAGHSKVPYSSLANSAVESISLMVSDDVLGTIPKETDLVEEIVSNKQFADQLRESLGERRYTVLSMWSMGWHLREIAEHLEKMGYTNRDGEQITRQAVKAILTETLKAISKMRVVKNLR